MPAASAPVKVICTSASCSLCLHARNPLTEPLTCCHGKHALTCPDCSSLLLEVLHTGNILLNTHQVMIVADFGMCRLQAAQCVLWYAGNILLDGNGVVKVADFGLSRLQAATCGEPLTAELGTWQWMAPEVVAPWDKRGAVYTEKADVYSFGIVM